MGVVGGEGGEGGVGAMGAVGTAVFAVSVSVLGGVSDPFWAQELDNSTEVSRQTRTSPEVLFIIVPTALGARLDTPKSSLFTSLCQ